MTTGYVMNSYPMASTTFIGREIAALEARGHPVRRYAVRPWEGALTDPGDLRERSVTQYLLKGPRSGLAGAALRGLARSPLGAARGLRLAMRLCREARGAAVPRLARHVAYWLEAAALRHYAARDAITHLHAHFSSNATTVAMLCDAMGGPGYSFTLHGPTDFLGAREDALGPKIEAARFTACISHYARAQGMIFAGEAHWRRMHVIRCGVTPALYEARDAAPGEGPEGPEILFVGRLAAIKGVPLLIDAVARLSEEHPALRLTLVGDGPERAGLEARAAARGIAGRTAFTGYLDQAEVARRMRGADVFALPSFAEGVPVVLMEAMAARRPVIAPRVAGVPELVEDGVSGFCVPPGDADALTARLGDLLRDPARRAAMGEAGRARVEAAFDVAAQAEKLEGLLRDGGQGSRPRE